MKKFIFTIMILCFAACQILPSYARERSVSKVGKAEIVSEGLYFKVCDVCNVKNTVTINVQLKNKSVLSQAVYIELTDSEGKSYAAKNAESLNIFAPLKFNKTMTQDILFTVPSSSKNYWLALYSRDIFKKDKKQLITKFSLQEVKKEIGSK